MNLAVRAAEWRPIADVCRELGYDPDEVLPRLFYEAEVPA